MSLEYVEINPASAKPADACVIWLHGLGDTGHGFAPIVPELKLDAGLSIRFIFPHEQIQPVTINGGMSMNAWYDIKSLDMEGRADEAGVLQSMDKVKQLVEAQMAKGIASERIVLAGFSQGGVIALHLATRFEHKLAGVLAMSTYMCKSDLLPSQKHQANQQTAFMMCHGSYDNVVPMVAGLAAKQTLLDNGYQVAWKDYPMEHSVCPQQITDVARFLTECLS
jgi:phospholipase/carboxylesterase